MDSTTSPTDSLFREIERRHEGGRDWDHEGTLATLELEGAVDRRETGCTSHDYYIYDDGHYLVWRGWSDAGRQTVRQCASDAATGRRPRSPHDTHDDGDMSTTIVRTRVSNSTSARLDAAATTSRLPKDALVRAGINHVIREVESGAEIAGSVYIGPELKLSETTRRRMAEMDHVLGIEEGHGIAETVLSNLVADVMGGDAGLILGCWEFDDPEVVEANLRCLSARWTMDDTLAQIRSRKEGA